MTHADQSTGELPRKFGFWTGLFVVAASMVGAAILTISGPIAVKTGSNPTMLWLWLLGGFLSLAGALPLAEMATAYPRVGGDYFFIQKAFGPALGFIYGWATALCGFAAPIAAVSSIAAGLLHGTLGAAFGDMAVAAVISEAGFSRIAGSILIVGFSWAHCVGHRGSSWIHNLATIFKVGVLFVFAAAIAFSQRSSFANLTATTAHGATLPILGMSLVQVMYAYVGWNGAVYLAGEIRDPGKLLPRCVVGGCVAVTMLYLFINVAYALAIGPQALSSYSEDQVKETAKLIARLTFSTTVADSFMLLIGLGVLASLSAFILSGARVVFALSRNGMFPGWAGGLSTRTQAPVNATLALGLLSLICLWSGSFSALQDYAGFGLGIMASVVIAAIFWLRRLPDYAPAFRVPGYPIVPAVFVAVNTAMLAAAAVDDPKTSTISVVTMALGFPLYVACRPKSKPKTA